MNEYQNVLDWVEHARKHLTHEFFENPAKGELFLDRLKIIQTIENVFIKEISSYKNDKAK